MPRQPKKVEVLPAIDPSLDQQKIDGAMAHLRAEEGEMALARAQHESSVRAVAQRLGYQLPADCTDPDLIQRDIAANMRRSVEACLEVGRGLRVLKEACEHGNFLARLKVIGVEHTVAIRFMQAAMKFSKAAAPQLLTAAGSQSKLFELLVLDDEQIEELELTGQTGELALDDVATMSQKELRAALRELRAEKEASDHLLTEKNKRIDQLKAQQKRIAKLPADDALAELQKEATAIMRDACGAIVGGLRQAIIAVTNHDSEDHTAFLAGLVGQVQAEVTALRAEFRLPDTSSAADRELAAEVAQWAGK